MSDVTCQQMAETIAARSEAAQEWLKELIRFPSTQGNEAPVQLCLGMIRGGAGLRAIFRGIRLECELRRPPVCSARRLAHGRLRALRHPRGALYG